MIDDRSNLEKYSPEWFQKHKMKLFSEISDRSENVIGFVLDIQLQSYKFIQNKYNLCWNFKSKIYAGI